MAEKMMMMMLMMKRDGRARGAVIGDPKHRLDASVEEVGVVLGVG